MRKRNKSYVILAAVALTFSVLAAALILATGASPALAVPTQLEATKSVDVSEIPPGGTVNYTIVLNNNTASQISQVVVSDELDASFASADNLEILPAGTIGGAVSESGYVTFTVMNLAANGTVTLTFEATLASDVVPGTSVANTAVVDDGTDETPTNEVVFEVSQAPALQIFDPDNGDLLTQRSGDQVEVFGRVWTEFDPAPFPDPPVLQSISNLGGAGTYNVSWTAVADADNYRIQESRDREVWTDLPSVAAPDTSAFVSGKSAGTWYYRVAAYKTYNGVPLPSRWSNVESVKVTSFSSSSGLSVEPADMSAFAADVDVEVSINGGSWEPATVVLNPDEIPNNLPEGLWATWTYDWTLPEADGESYTISARAGYSGGSTYGEDSITITLSNATTYLYLPILYKRYPPIPFPPTLTVSDPGETDDYTVSWTYNYPDVPVTLGYQLAESTSADFTSPTYYDVNTSSRQFTDKADGTYYYRVRGRNSYGYGEWSNVESVLVDTYDDRIYEFTSSTEGWELARADEDDRQQLPQPVEENSMLYHLVWGKADFSIISPMEEAPPVPYTIKTRVDIVDREYVAGHEYAALTGMTWGIIFGGNDADPCPAWRDDPNGCLNHYYRVLITWDQFAGKFLWELKRIDYHEGDAGGGQGRSNDDALISWREVSGFEYTATGWNEWRIEVTDADSNNIRVFMNDRLLGEATDHDYIDDPYFGTFLSSTDELGGVATKWDWFRVER